MNKKPKGTLIIIGGREDKEDSREILDVVAERARHDGASLVIATVPTNLPEEVGNDYTERFHELGVSNIDVLDIRVREDAFLPQNIEKLIRASVVFFTGGKQLRITSQIGDTPIFKCLHDMYMQGATIAGTSAGAAAMSETMLISGIGNQSNDSESFSMAPGLGLLPGVVIDTHFAERGRIGRLMGAVAQNPKNLGLGIDEDTALVVNGNNRFRVIGSGAVYVLDGSGITYSSLAEEQTLCIISTHDVKMHLLAKDNGFDLTTRQPLAPVGASSEGKKER